MKKPQPEVADSSCRQSAQRRGEMRRERGSAADHGGHRYRRDGADEDDREKTEPIRLQRQAVRTEPYPTLDAALAQRCEPHGEREQGKQKKLTAETRYDGREGGNGRGDAGRQRGGLFDHEPPLRKLLEQVAARRRRDHHERQIRHADREPSHGSDPRRRKASDGNAGLGEAPNESIGVERHLSLLSVLRRARMARWTAIFSAPTVMPLSRAASFKVSSRNFSSSTARRCPGGSASIACLRASG